ncbi:flagellar hook-length control protein FliK [uncultured Sphingomonas sp.]|uniref:flagellar hook-length control protein FliK n=1 Tax=uncultured Sphingomonas sp. TaxID=158754 RepID=UPI0035C96378
MPIADPIAATPQGAAPTPVIAVSAAVPVAPAPMVPVAAAPAGGPASASVRAAAAPPPVTPAVQFLPQPMLASGAAGRVFAAALHAAAGPAAASAQGAGEDHDPMVAAMLAGSAVAQAVPVAAAQGAGFDMSQSGWPTRMAEQIEALRDAADATSTSIRVIPDALGPVDLQVRRDGDQVHVHFSAANPETRTLIADAQPQLAAAAADRGLKLGQASVGGGAADWSSSAGQNGAGQNAWGQNAGGQNAGGQNAGGQGAPGQDQPARRSTPASARSAPPLSAASDDAATDTRIA